MLPEWGVFSVVNFAVLVLFFNVVILIGKFLFFIDYYCKTNFMLISRPYSKETNQFRFFELVLA